MLNKFGTGEGGGSLPVKLNVLFTSAVPVLVEKAPLPKLGVPNVGVPPVLPKAG